MEIKIHRIVIFSLLFSFLKLNGQSSKYDLETGINISTSNQTPFWMRSNQYGIVPFESKFVTMRGGYYQEYKPFVSQDSISLFDKKKARIRYGYGIQGVINTGKVNQILFPEAYLKLNFRAFEIYAGRRREIFGIVDSTLSSGSMTWSGNTLPLPKLQLSTLGYASIGKAKLIAVNMGYAHGWFDNSTPLKNSFLHQKWFYLKMGKPSWKVNVYGGFNHQVQWGGKLDLTYKISYAVDNKLPSDFSDYLYLVSGISLNYSERQQKIDLSKYTAYDLENRVGNHIGTIDIGTSIDFNNHSLTLYKQSIYDDGSLIFLGNISDGLYGLSLCNKNNKSFKNRFHLQKIVVELFNSQNQGGKLGPNQTIPELRGRDDYFNHGQFINGWAYSKNGIGSPFILPQYQVNNNLPSSFISSTKINFFTNNNRVKAFYTAIALSYNKINNQTRLSISENLGTYRKPFDTRITQFSLMNSTSFFHPKSKLIYKFILSHDNGSLLTKNWGIYFGLQKNFTGKFKI